MDYKDKILSSLNIIKRLPPSQVEKNLSAISTLVPDYTDDLYQKVDKPLEVNSDESKPFICCEFNRDGDSFRSPQSNQYFPTLDDGLKPSASLRQLEEKANQLFEEYKKLYYDEGIASVYMWDKEDGYFASAWLIKKNIKNQKGIKDGSWNSIHVVDIKADESKKKLIYKLTSSIVLDINVDGYNIGTASIGGAMTRKLEESYSVEDTKDPDSQHLERIGQMIENLEQQMRSQIDVVCIQKTRDIICQARLSDEYKQKYQLAQ